MNRETIEALAFLRSIRNVKKGLITRSRIIRILKNSRASLKEIVKKMNMSYSAIRRQLKLMERENIVKKRGKKWSLTGYGQKELTDFLRF